MPRLVNESFLKICWRSYALFLQTNNTQKTLTAKKYYSSSTFKDPTIMTASNLTMFKGHLDRYNGVTVSSEEESCDSVQEFSEKLEESISKWIENNKKAIWFKVDIKQADWIPILANKGFKFHHTRENYVAMYKWLPKDQSDRVPSYSHTMVGVGGLVVNDKSEVLIVSENYLNFPHWKLPGGVVDPEEDLIDAVIREVKEETNIETEFYSLLSVRHTHHRQFGCSDLYIVFILMPLTTDIVKCEREINDCKWMQIDEYLGHSNVSQMNKMLMHEYLEFKKRNIKIVCMKAVHEVLSIPYQIYHLASE